MIGQLNQIQLLSFFLRLPWSDAINLEYSMCPRIRNLTLNWKILSGRVELIPSPIFGQENRLARNSILSFSLQTKRVLRVDRSPLTSNLNVLKCRLTFAKGTIHTQLTAF